LSNVAELGPNTSHDGDDSNVSPGKRVLELHDELQSMPEFQLLQKIQTFQLSLEVFEGNYRDLRRLLDWQSQHPDAQELWHLRNRHLLEAFQKEVARLLHNFVAGAASLIDHTRLHHRELYADSGQLPEYDAEVSARFLNNPLANFIKGLRQYCQHYRVPPLVARMSYSAEPPSSSSTVLLDKKKLMEFSGWSAPAIKYLDQQGDSPQLLEAIAGYHDLVGEFYRWFSGMQRHIHKSDLERVAAKQKEIDSIAIPDHLQAIATLVAARKWNPDECFAGILAPGEWREAAEHPEGSRERCEKLLELVERRVRIDEDLKNRIRALYGEEGLTGDLT
jgi:hypothetical protein